MRTAQMITVGLIEDSRLTRDAIAAMLEQLHDMRVVAAETADPAKLAAAHPQVLLLDVELRDHDSVGLATELKRTMPDAKIIVIDLNPMHEDITEFVSAGVSGFVLKDADGEELIDTIRSVVAGKTVLPARLTGPLFSQIAKKRTDAGTETMRIRVLEDERITTRELQVIECIGEGLSNKEIARRLNIATHTVKSHVRNVMEKLALHTRLQIAAHFRRERPAAQRMEYMVA
jgi:DNA-binding NarL/FixJ family response regulator